MTATQKAPIAASDVVDAEVAGEHGEDGEVDQVAGAADDAELEQLPPARRAAGGGAEPVGEFRRRSSAASRWLAAVDDDGVAPKPVVQICCRV